MSVIENPSENTAATPSFGRVLRQAPWRRNTQVLSGVAVVAVLLVAMASMALAETSRAAAAGRDVQQLRHAIKDIRYENALLRASIASSESVIALEARARQLGLAPFTPERIFHLEVSGVENLEDNLATQPENSTPDLPLYDETLKDWLAERMGWFLVQEQ